MKECLFSLLGKIVLELKYENLIWDGKCDVDPSGHLRGILLIHVSFDDHSSMVNFK